jgi:preprotein translocase subunit SecG
VDIILLVLHVVLSLGIITLVLLQKGAGASAGAAFGGGGAGSVFGATGSANFLSKTTAIFAIGFFVNSLVLAYMAANRDVPTDSVLDALTAPVTEISEPAEESSIDESNVPLADVPAAVETEPSSDIEVPPADVPPADMPPADEPLPAGE